MDEKSFLLVNDPDICIMVWCLDENFIKRRISFYFKIIIFLLKKGFTYLLILIGLALFKLIHLCNKNLRLVGFVFAKIFPLKGDAIAILFCSQVGQINRANEGDTVDFFSHVNGN